MEKITEETWLSETIQHLENLQGIYNDKMQEAVEEHNDEYGEYCAGQVDEIEELIKYLNKTN